MEPPPGAIIPGTMPTVSAQTIERIQAPSREQLESYVRQNKPVIMTGIADQWPAFHKWSPEYLKSVAGEAEIQARYEETGNFHNNLTGELEHRKMTLGELMDRFTADQPDSNHYLTECPLEGLAPTLLDDVDLSKATTASAESPLGPPLLFIGPDASMPLHYHGEREAVLCQLHGSKEVLLFAPDQFSRVYPRRFYQTSFAFSQVDWHNPDPDRFPKIERAQAIRFTLEPGEILFIPVHWWHYTAVKGLTFSVTAMWCAKTAQYSYPFPGLQVHARNFVLKMQRLQGRLLGRNVEQPLGC